jgi:hypothetical protein
LSGILLARILEGKVNPPLKRLDPTNGPVRHHRCTCNLVFHLQNFNLPKEKVHLVCPASLGIPTRSLHRGTRSAKRKGRRKIPNREPHLLPVDDLVTQLVRDVLSLLPLKKLQPSSPDYIYLRFVGMGFQMEEILKQIEVELNPQESFAKIEKNRYVENGVRGQVMHLNPPMEKEDQKKSKTGKSRPRRT